ncbi:MAG: lipoyl protein ligase domain-containing protein [Acidimicrobiales bacterium]
MGAVPGDGLLTPAPADWFDVEPFRRSRRRRVVVRRADRPAIVLGSTQPEGVVDPAAAGAHGVAVVRRRSGGGAVHVQPDDPVWVDLWVPRGDPLWDDDVHAGAEWVGRWWAAALHSLGAGPLSVHRGPSTCGEWSGTVCFAGVGPAEVTAGERKVVGVAQWRARQGALFHSAAYLHWDPAPLVALLAVAADERQRMAEGLATVAVGLADLLDRPAGAGLWASVTDRLLGLLPGGDWDVGA